MSNPELVKKFLQSLKVPTGRLAGNPVVLAPFQKQFIDGAFADGVNVGCLSVGRGNGKSTLSAGLALGELLGAWSDASEREILIAAKTQNQARICWNYVASFCASLPDELRESITIRRQPRFEIQFDDAKGPHILSAISADGKSALGTSPTLAILDERGHWPVAAGDELEMALLTGLSKRDGKALIISTSASNDQHPFSQWLDKEAPSVYRQEHRPTKGLPADDIESLLIANPAIEAGIGPSLERLTTDAALAISRGGSALSRFQLLSRNERVQENTADALIPIDEWFGCEVSNLPERKGHVVVGLDLGGSTSMTAAAMFWPETGRLEAMGAFPSDPDLSVRGEKDAVGNLYLQMRDAGELFTVGNKTVPIDLFIRRVLIRLEGEHISCFVGDKYRQSELSDALLAIGSRTPVEWRRFGPMDGGEDTERFRRAVFDKKVKVSVSTLLRCAIGEAIVRIDSGGRSRIDKGRNNARIDAASASVIAVAQGMREASRPVLAGRMAWG